MWVWLFMIVGVIGVRFLIPDAIGEKKKKLMFLSVAFLIVVFISGSRCPYLTGSVDLYTYFMCYKNAINLSIGELMDVYNRFETGYLVLNKILAWLVPWEYFIIYFEAAFCTGILMWYFYRNADDVFIAVIFYICVGPWSFLLTGFRQGFAIGICLIAFELMKKRHLIWDMVSVGLILLAYSFHTTAIVFFAVFFIRYLKLNKKVFLISIIGVLAVLTFSQGIINLLNNWFDTSYRVSYMGNTFGGIVPIVIYTVAIIFGYNVSDKTPDKYDDFNFELIVLFIGLCIYITRYEVTVFERISYYFTPVASVVLTNGIARQKNKVVRNLVLVFSIVLSIVLYIYRMEIQGTGYHFYWEYLESLN